MLPYSHDELSFPVPNDPTPSSSSSARLESSDPPAVAMASPDPTTGSNLPPSLWLPLLSIAFACVMFVSFRRAGASGIFRGEDSLLHTSVRRLRRFVDEKRGRGGVYLPTSSSPSSSHPYALSPTTPASASATPLSSPLFPRIVVSPSSPSKEAKFGLQGDGNGEEDDEEEDVLPLAWEADEIGRHQQVRDGAGVLGFISGGQRRS